MNLKKEVLASQKDLKNICFNKEYIITKAKFGPSKETKIPLRITKDFAFFVATIIGDGHLRKDKLQISIELTDKKLLERIQLICKHLFNREFNITKVKQRTGRKLTYKMCMDSKAVYNLLNKVFEIPIGNKSNIVKVPKIILDSNKSIKAAFLLGIMLTEGGKRRRGLGLSTSSKELWKGLTKLFNELGVKVLLDKWIYKKYKKEYYGISFKREYINSLTRECRSGQTGWV